jgi:ABC-type transport system substrate-binding protein
VFLGFAEPASGIFPSWHPAYDKQWENTVYPYDPAKAKDLLNQAGLNENHPLAFSLHTTNVSEYVDEVQLLTIV